MISPQKITPCLWFDENAEQQMSELNAKQFAAMMQMKKIDMVALDAAGKES
jgi:predicted 3-demethylubiquinone-9 3-methyltransferase (glyoxalase superfamily)